MKILQPTGLEKRKMPEIARREPTIPQVSTPIDIVDGEYVEEEQEVPPATPPQSPQPAATTQNTPWGKIIGGGFVLMFLIVIASIFLFRGGEKEEVASSTQASATEFTVLAVTEIPTEPIRVPLGSGLRWAAVPPDAKFEVISSTGEKVAFPSDGYKKISNGTWIKFRSLEKGPVTIQVRVVPLQ